MKVLKAMHRLIEQLKPFFYALLKSMPNIAMLLSKLLEKKLLSDCGFSHTKSFIDSEALTDGLISSPFWAKLKYFNFKHALEGGMQHSS